MSIEKRLKDILAGICGEQIDLDQLCLDDDIKVLNINSVVFIKLLVEIEKEFGIEFEDEDLDLGKFPNLRSIADYISQRSGIKTL